MNPIVFFFLVMYPAAMLVSLVLIVLAGRKACKELDVYEKELIDEIIRIEAEIKVLKEECG